MIIKGRGRGRSQQLAAHLLRRDQNEDIRVYELRGVMATDVPGALAEMEALSASVPGKRPLYHASISPEAHTPLTRDQIRIAADTLERELKLTGQPRVIVVHRKADREHVHVVWSRIDVERQRLISDAWNYRAHEAAARKLETEFGHRAIQGVHVPRETGPRPRPVKDHEYRQAERAGRSPQDIGAELAALWREAGSGAAFRTKLDEAGYRLARGDRRIFVVIDRAGNVHSLARRLGITTAQLRAKLRETDLVTLPSVQEVREVLRAPADRGQVQIALRKAAQDVTHRLRRRPRDRVVTRAAREATFRGAARWIGEAQHPRAQVASIVRGRYLTLARLRALRAAILGDFAAKMDDAARRLEDSALLAALARLADERDAALREIDRFQVSDRGIGPTAKGRARPRRHYAVRRRHLHRSRKMT